MPLESNSESKPGVSESGLRILLDRGISRVRFSFDRCLIFLFLAFILIPAVVLLVIPGYGVDHWGDRRAIHAAPQFSLRIDQWKQLPNQFELFIGDRICYRNKLIRLQNMVGLFAFGSAPLGTTCLKTKNSPDGAIAGQDGWLFYSGHGCIQGSRRTDPFTVQELNDWSQVHLQRLRWLRDRGIGYLFFVAPDKHTIYPEFVPTAMKLTGAKSRYDQLYEHLERVAPNVDTVDLRPALLRAKHSQLCYYRSDSHWNRLGALIASSAILGKLGTRYPGIGAIASLADFEITSAEGAGGDIAETHKVKNYYSDLYFNIAPRTAADWAELPSPPADIRVWTTTHPDASRPRIVFISDSFGTDMVPYLCAHSSRFSWYVQIYADEFPCELIERESPDLVIFEHVERKLNHLDPRSANPSAVCAPPDRLALLGPTIH